ncbi:MAG: ATP-binding protein [Candidatus Omnitrophica bacterium]|nr:ATP-binding protein [Candidatus Omnitrophota bacterium]
MSSLSDFVYLLYGKVTLGVSIFSFFLGFFLLFLAIKSKAFSSLHKIWFVLCVTIGGWNLGYYFTMVPTITKEQALISSRISHISGILIVPFFLQFVSILRPIYFKHRRVILSLCYFSCGIIAILTLTPFVVIDVAQKLNFKYYPVGSWGYAFYVFTFIFWIVYAHVVLIRALMDSKGMDKNQILYFLVGTVPGFLGGATCFPLIFGIPVYPYLSVLIGVYVFTTTYAVVQFRLMDVKVAVARAGIFIATYILVLGIPFFLGYLTGSWVFSVILMGILATVGPIIYRVFHKKVEDLILFEQKRYQSLLLEASKGMLRENNLGRLLKLIAYVVRRVVKIKFVAVFLLDENGKYSLAALRDHGIFPKKYFFEENHSLIKRLKETLGAIEYDYLSKLSIDPFSKQSHLIVPSFSEEGLLAFLVLGAKENGAFYSEDDIKTFEILSRQATLAIEHCIFLAKFKQTQEKIFTAEKLASIGGMADGVAHQIKNRLNHFSIAGGELKLEAQDFIDKNPDFFKKGGEPLKSIEYFIKIADSIIENVKKTDGVIKGILNFARTEETDTFFSNFSLGEIIEMSVELVKVKHQLTEFPLTVEIEASDEVYGVKAQVMEVIYNLLDNAYEACYDKRQYKLSGEEKKAYKPEIILRLITLDKCFHVEVSDNGVGIEEKDKDKIFAPFFTTKSSYTSGTGIGMYVIKRVVEENHKGRIWFDSEYLKGTTVFFELPKV